MDSKAKIHDDIMSSLREYLSNTPEEIIKEEIAQISKLQFEGVSAIEYFNNFHSYYAPGAFSFSQQIKDFSSSAVTQGEKALVRNNVIVGVSNALRLYSSKIDVKFVAKEYNSLPIQNII